MPDFSFGSVRQKINPSFYYVGPKIDVLSSVALNIRIDPDRTAETVRAIERTWKRVSGGQPLQEYFAGQFMLRLYIDNIIQGGKGTAAAKYEALRAAGVTCVQSPADMGKTMKAVLEGKAA